MCYTIMRKDFTCPIFINMTIEDQYKALAWLQKFRLTNYGARATISGVSVERNGDMCLSLSYMLHNVLQNDTSRSLLQLQRINYRSWMPY